MLSRRALAWPGVIARIDAVDPDQVAGEADDLLLRGEAHPDIVPPAPEAPCCQLRLASGVAVTGRAVGEVGLPDADSFGASRAGVLICYRVRRLERLRPRSAMSGWRSTADALA